MAVNYGLLEPVDIAGQFMAGQQQAQQNQLAKQQNEMRQQEFGMRQQEFATQAEDRKLKLDRANERNDFLTKLSDQMKQGGHTLNRETLSSMMNFGLKSNEESLVNLATKGLQALDEQDQFQSEMGRIAPKAPAAPMQPGALGTGTFDVNAPTNALVQAPVAAPSTNAMAGGYTRSQIEQMLSNPNARINTMGKNLLGALPKEAAPAAVPVSIAEYERSKTDPQFMRFLQERSAANRAPAPAAQPVAKDEKAPSGYRFTKTGELEAIPGGPAAKGKEPTVSEQNATYNINRVLNAATEIKNITAKDPSALAPSFSEAAARSMGAEGAANVARSSNRQIVYGAQRDALDALLYLATGAAYNREQLQGAWDSYMPAYTDDNPTKIAKQERLGTLLEDAKTRAGKAWTPKMESAMKSLMSPSASSAVSGKVTPAADVDTSNPLLK